MYGYMNTVNVKINGVEYEVPSGITALRACEDYANLQIPRFCYHEKLKIAGNCRMCLVEIKPGPPKPAASCAMPVANGMEIFTESEMVKKAREGVTELLLINHPLDCPICDQAGECDLQDQAYIYGKDHGNFNEFKRAVEDKYMGPLIKTKMNRCIHCTRCVRFIEDVAGFAEIGAVNRGENMEITTLNNAISSELSGNIIDLCPVGALISKPYTGKARSWELKKTESIDVFDGIGSNIRIDSRSNEILRVLPRNNEEINEEWISDKTRFAIDGLVNQRIDSAYIMKNRTLTPVKLEIAMEKVANILKNSSNIGVISDKMTDLETAFAAKILCEKVGGAKISCSETDLNIDSSCRGNYRFNSGISGIDQADFILIIGANVAKDSPIINARIRKNAKKNIPIYVLDKPSDFKYNVNFLPNNTDVLWDIFENKAEISKQLQAAKNPMMIVGEDAISGENGLNLHKLTIEIANKCGFVTKDWNGYCILHKNAATVGNLDIKLHNSRTSEILLQAENGTLETLLLIGNCEVDFAKISSKCKVIHICSHGNSAISNASVVIPALTYVEKNAIYLNTEGRAQATLKAVEIISPEFDECATICGIISCIDKKFAIKSRAEILGEIQKTHPEIPANFNKITPEIPSFQGEIQKTYHEIESKDYNFYMTDRISKNSINMANCVREILFNNENDDKK